MGHCTHAARRPTSRAQLARRSRSVISNQADQTQARSNRKTNRLSTLKTADISVCQRCRRDGAENYRLLRLQSFYRLRASRARGTSFGPPPVRVRQVKTEASAQNKHVPRASRRWDEKHAEALDARKTLVFSRVLANAPDKGHSVYEEQFTSRIKTRHYHYWQSFC